MQTLTVTAKHTPGDWTRRDTPDYAEIIAEGVRQPVALVGRAEDANLVAAAPDLLAALKFAEQGFTLIVENSYAEGIKELAQRRLAEVRAAIAKAEGR